MLKVFFKSSHLFILIFYTLTMSLSFDDAVLMHEQDFVFEGKPTVTDWDDDGLPDILFGERVPSASQTSNSTVGFWKNNGTETSPSFSDAGNVKADGSDISIEVG